MNTTTTIIGIILLFLFLLPFIISGKKQKAGKKQIIKELFSFAEKMGGKITEHEQWNDKAIGLDRDKHKLYFVKKTADISIEKELKLADFQKCIVSKTENTVSPKEAYDKRIDKVHLLLSSKIKNNTQEKI